jgi:chromosome segregation ATPase
MIAGKPACHRSPHQYALVNPFDTSENYDLCNLCQAEIEKIPASTAAPVPSTADWTTKLYWLLDQVQQLQELRDKQSHAFTTLELAHNQAVGKLTARDEEMTALQAKLADLQKDHNDLLEEHDKLLKQPASSVDLPADLNAKLESFIPAAR